MAAIRRRIQPALMGFHNVVSAVPPRLEEFGTRVGENLHARISSASAAFQAWPVHDFMSKVHQGGVLGFTDLRERGKAIFGGSWRTEDIGTGVSIAGSVADTSLPGFSEGNLVNVKALSQDVENVNLDLTNTILNAFAMDGWEEFASKQGVTVSRRSSGDIELAQFPAGVGPKAEGNTARFLCVKAAGKVDAPVDDVYQMFVTNDHVMRYNSICQECLDLGWLDRSTKLTWSSSKRMGPILSRDFVTRCHYRRLRDGSVVMATMSEQLPCDEQRDAGLSSHYCRMQITFAGYLLRPIQGGAATEFNMISLANPGGVLDSPFGARLTNFLCATGPVGMVNSIREILQEQAQATANLGKSPSQPGPGWSVGAPSLAVA